MDKKLSREVKKKFPFRKNVECLLFSGQQSRSTDSLKKYFVNQRNFTFRQNKSIIWWQIGETCSIKKSLLVFSTTIQLIEVCVTSLLDRLFSLYFGPRWSLRCLSIISFFSGIFSHKGSFSLSSVSFNYHAFVTKCSSSQKLLSSRNCWTNWTYEVEYFLSHNYIIIC